MTDNIEKDVDLRIIDAFYLFIWITYKYRKSQIHFNLLIWIIIVTCYSLKSVELSVCLYSVPKLRAPPIEWGKSDASEARSSDTLQLT